MRSNLLNLPGVLVCLVKVFGLVSGDAKTGLRVIGMVLIRKDRH